MFFHFFIVFLLCREFMAFHSVSGDNHGKRCCYDFFCILCEERPYLWTRSTAGKSVVRAVLVPLYPEFWENL